ncbi:MAG: FGGY-family carbohydrate kinase [Gammaproteobacteria bacterium]|nr:FGGY-family carbohydrate kinase [Gammaproteobacteria bacterium]
MTESYLGIDVGTSGVRAILIDRSGKILASSSTGLPASIQQDSMLCQQPGQWWQAVLTCLQQITDRYDCAGLQGIAIDGTSGTTLLTDLSNKPISPALMYNDTRPADLINELCQQAPPGPACSQSSALAKAVWLYRQTRPETAFYVQQQADWILARFSAKPGLSDWNNALKLGFDVQHLRWPDWIRNIDIGKGKLPEVFPPGKQVATIAADVARQTGLPDNVCLHAGTTDSIAAFLASGASQAGDAVTSLGSTLVLKLCTHKPIISSQHGIYSHRLDQNRWLAGGASNSGGAVLKSLFTNDELVNLSKKMNVEQDTGLNYYPLPTTGERFPVADAKKQAQMQPVPENRVTQLQALFEGIAQIERTGYELLEKLGNETVQSLRTCGGGAANPSWSRIRQRIVMRPLVKANQLEAAYGSALLAAGKL